MAAQVATHYARRWSLTVARGFRFEPIAYPRETHRQQFDESSRSASDDYTSIVRMYAMCATAVWPDQYGREDVMRHALNHSAAFLLRRALPGILSFRSGRGLIIACAACQPQVRIETGNPAAGGELAFVSSIDNPDLTVTDVPLKVVPTQWNGPMPVEIQVTNSGHMVANGDFMVVTANGDGPALGNETSGYASVNDEELPARPDAEGTYTAPNSPARVELVSEGLRLGYNWLNAQLVQVRPNHSRDYDFPNPRLSLDPNVALVPVEAVVVFHSKDADGKMENGMSQQGLIPQLAFWDRVPFPEKTVFTDGTAGEIKSVQNAMAWHRRDAAGQYRIGTQAAPDTVWDKCGVQFRLVNYFELQVPLRNVFPARGNDQADANRFWPIGTVDDAPLRENHRLATSDPRHWDGTVTVIFMGRVGFNDAPEVGRALIGLSSIGVSLNDGGSSDGVVAHELGHLSGLRDADGDEKDAQGNPKYDVMVGLGPGTEPTPAECAAMKRWADGHRDFWNHPPPRPHG
jgi:hypothetical protein